MEKFVRTRSVPLCHFTICDYELSRFDIAFIPLERRISDRLLRLAKGQQRPQCSKCQFYIDANELEDFYDHIDNCDGDLTRCRYCSCPYSIDELDNHRAPCREDRSSQNDKLIQFIMKRTKYPVTKEQIRIFIQQERNDAGDVDPLTVVYTLAAFGKNFILKKKLFLYDPSQDRYFHLMFQLKSVMFVWKLVSMKIFMSLIARIVINCVINVFINRVQ
jgi:hypothetical protein